MTSKAPSPAPRAAPAALRAAPVEALSTAPPVVESWARIEAWLAKHAPSLLAQLPKGASAKVFERAEKAMGFALPADLRQSWERHNGNGFGAGLVGNWSLLAVEHAMKEHALMAKLAREGAFGDATADRHPAITRAWWSTGWIPIVGSGSGHLICVDTSPPPGGTPGQVILFFHDEGKRLRIATSFAAWWAKIADDLERGVYRWDAAEGAFDHEAFLRSSLEGQRTYG